MATDRDPSIMLPDPPPPRPSARQAAIEAALRRFDGVEEPVTQAPQRTGWARTHRRPIGALVTASLIAVIGIPATIVALRDHPTNIAPAPQAAPPGQVATDCAGDACGGAQLREQADELAPQGSPAATAPRGSATPPQAAAPPAALPDQQQQGSLDVAENEAPAEVPAPAPAMAAAAPPPPPPPPPPAPERSERYAESAGAEDLVVTGSRVSRSGVSAQNKAIDSASPLAVVDTFAPFLADLQAAVRADDRGAIVRLVAYPLRVRFEDGPHDYETAQALQRDFDRVFTPAVRRSILSQEATELRSRGRLKGTGRIWFGQTRSGGPVRIREVNP